MTRALQAGEIQTSRYDSYVRLYEKASQIKEWEQGVRVIWKNGLSLIWRQPIF